MPDSITPIYRLDAQAAQGAPLPQPRIRVGRVNSYFVDNEGLRIKLDTGAIDRSIIFIATNAPYYRAAVSIAMLAFNGRYTKDTYHTDPTADHQYISVRIETQPRPNGVEDATAIGLGKEALVFEKWIIRPEDVLRNNG
jgi:hypothetical protein